MKKLKLKIEFFVETTKNGLLAYSMFYPISVTSKGGQDLRDKALAAARDYFEIFGIDITWQNIQMRIDLDRSHNTNLFVNTKFIAKKANNNPALLS
jgi:hypothetical protein